MQTVLILEDEADIRELMAITLTSSTVHCELCSHLSDALSMLTRMKPDFIITDLKLPDGSGIDFLKQARKLYPDVPVAVATAFADTDSAIEALRQGAVDYLKKPIDTKALRALVSEQLAKPAASTSTVDGEFPSENTTTTPNSEEGASELDQINTALETHRWNKRAAAQALGMSYRQLRYRIEKFGLE